MEVLQFCIDTVWRGLSAVKKKNAVCASDIKLGSPQGKFGPNYKRNHNLNGEVMKIEPACSFTGLRVLKFNSLWSQTLGLGLACWQISDGW